MIYGKKSNYYFSKLEWERNDDMDLSEKFPSMEEIIQLSFFYQTVYYTLLFTLHQEIAKFYILTYILYSICRIKRKMLHIQIVNF